MYDPCLDPGIGKKKKKNIYGEMSEVQMNFVIQLIATELRLNT